MSKVGNTLNNSVGSCQLISTIPFVTGTATYTFNVPVSSYNNFKIVYVLNTTLGAPILNLNFSTNNGSSYITTNYVCYLKRVLTTATAMTNITATAAFMITSSAALQSQGEITLYNLTSGSGDICGLSQSYIEASTAAANWSSFSNATSLSNVVVTNIQLNWGSVSGTVTGYACLYGIMQ